MPLWLPLTLGAAMVVLGAYLVIRFFARRQVEPSRQAASGGRGVSLILGALVIGVGTLMLLLGAFGLFSPEAGGG